MKVSEIMTKEVVSINQREHILSATELLLRHRLDGLPVIDDNRVLVGLVTHSDLLTKVSHLHVPTIIKFLLGFSLFRKDKKFIQEEIEKVKAVTVLDVMNQEPPLIYEGETVENAVMQLSRNHGVNPTSVVNTNRVLVGVITRYDVVNLGKMKKIPTEEIIQIPEAERKIESFIGNFQANYLFISKWRTRAWFIVNLSFLFVGGIIVVVLFW